MGMHLHKDSLCGGGHYIRILYVGEAVTKGFFLHNTKVTTTKINEDKVKEQNRGKNHIQGRIISQNEMIHLMLQYAEVYSDLNFIAFPTVPLELCAGVDKGSKDTSESCKAGNLPDIIRREIITVFYQPLAM